MMQGHGSMGVWEIETPTLIRYGQPTYDEFFVSEEAADIERFLKSHIEF